MSAQDQPLEADTEAFEAEDMTTNSTDARFSYTNDLLALLLVGFAVGATATYIYAGNDVPLWLASVNTVAIMSAVIWAFGKGIVKEAANLIKTE